MRLFVGFFLLMSFFGVVAQEDTLSFVLPTTVIESHRLQVFSPGSKVEEIDSASLSFFQGGNIGDVLSAEGPMHVKSYGGGGLATSAFRGGGAAHMAVVWNGFTLNSIMNGIQDFSLLPVLFFEEIKLNYGSGGSHWGSGAMGGALHLSNQLGFGEATRVSLGSNVGSFGSYGGFLKIKQEGRKASFSLAAYQQVAENDFKFIVPGSTGVQTEFDRLSNAALQSRGIMLNGAIKLKVNQLLNVAFWGQESTREIPPVLGTVASEATQSDQTFRVLANWRIVFKKSTLKCKLAYFEEKIDFKDSSSSIDANNLAKTTYAETEWLKNIGKFFKWNTGLQYAYLSANTSNYEQIAQQHRVSVFSALDFHWKKLDVAASCRQDLVNANLVPLTYGLESKMTLISGIDLKAKGGKIYRLPSLNDLYWSPGGNMDLKPEEGYSIEGGLVLYSQINKLVHFKTELTAFSKRVENWITWLPSNGTWSPFNVNEVWSRGSETKSTLTGLVKQIELKFIVGTNYIISTNESDFADPTLKGKQLIYTPLYSGFAKIGIAHKRLSIYYRHNYTGYRFVSTDNINYLTPYHLGSVQMGMTLDNNRWKGKLQFSVNNIWNHSYQVVLNRPMPMRNFTVGLSINFIHFKTEKS